MAIYGKAMVLPCVLFVESHTKAGPCPSSQVESDRICESANRTLPIPTVNDGRVDLKQTKGPIRARRKPNDAAIFNSEIVELAPCAVAVSILVLDPKLVQTIGLHGNEDLSVGDTTLPKDDGFVPVLLLDFNFVRDLA